MTSHFGTRFTNALAKTALASLVALQASCFPTWEAQESIASIAWANDDSAVAFVILRYESKPSVNPLVGTTLKRNMRHQLYVEAPTGRNRVAITGELPGQNATELYYMKARGYLVSGAVSSTARWFNHITTSGTVREVARVATTSCEGRYFDVIPSPDGAHLAVLKTAPGCTPTTGPGSPTGGTNGNDQLTITFLDAGTLLEVQSQTVTLPAWGIEWTWRPAGDFVVAASGTAWSLAPGRAPQSTTVPACFWPKTTSSQWSSTGTFLESDGQALVVSGHNPDATFGCQ